MNTIDCQNLMNTYDGMIEAAARDLIEAMKRKPGQTYVVAIPTTDAEAGRIAVVKDCDPIPARGAIIRPCDNAASGHSRWESVPHPAVYGILWQAMRREPILPR